MSFPKHYVQYSSIIHFTLCPINCFLTASTLRSYLIGCVFTVLFPRLLFVNSPRTRSKPTVIYMSSCCFQALPRLCASDSHWVCSVHCLPERSLISSIFIRFSFSLPWVNLGTFKSILNTVLQNTTFSRISSTDENPNQRKPSFKAKTTKTIRVQQHKPD